MVTTNITYQRPRHSHGNSGVYAYSTEEVDYPTVSYLRSGEGYLKESFDKICYSYVFPMRDRIEIYICGERGLWFAVSAHVREVCDKTKSTIVLLDEERGVEVLY